MYSDDYESLFDSYGFGDYDYEDELERDEWEEEFDEFDDDEPFEENEVVDWGCDDPNCVWCNNNDES